MLPTVDCKMRELKMASEEDGKELKSCSQGYSTQEEQVNSAEGLEPEGTNHTSRGACIRHSDGLRKAQSRPGLVSSG